MAEYIDREAARKELLDWCIITGYGGLTKYDVHTALDNISAADVVEVVRCRDCINYHRNVHDQGDDSYCSIFCAETDLDSYCSMGQRIPHRKDETNHDKD